MSKNMKRGVRLPKLEAYNKRLDYSYALGVFPALNLLESRPGEAMRLLLHPMSLENEGVALLREKCAELGVREEFAERVLKRESQKENCYAALVFRKYEAALSPDRPHVVLCQITDGGNLGTALRACLGFGIRDVAIIRPAVDAFDPHVLRASMGAFYRMNVRTFNTFEEYRALFPDHPLYPFMLDGAKPLDEVAKSHPARYALVFGNEQTGLPAHFATLGQSVIIPQSNEIDSLNLAVAVSIGTYAFTRPGTQERE